MKLVLAAASILWASAATAQFCERTDYQQYKDRLSADPTGVQRSYCAMTELRDLAGKAGDMRQMTACQGEATKISDAMSAAGLGVAPDCIGLDPKRTAAAFCKETEYCAAMDVTRGKVKAPSTAEALHCSKIVLAVLQSNKPMPKCP